MKQFRIVLGSAALSVAIVACGAPAPTTIDPAVSGANAAPRGNVLYQGGGGTGSGKYSFKSEGTGKTCAGTATYSIGTIALQIAPNGDLVKSYKGNTLSLVAIKFANCKELAGNYGFSFKPVAGKIDASGVDVAFKAVSGNCCTGTATLKGPLSAAEFTLSAYKTYQVTLSAAKVKGVLLFK